MIRKILVSATITVSLLGTLTLANHAIAAPLTRDQVTAELAQARTDGALHRTGEATDAYSFANVASTLSEAQVKDDMAAANKARSVLVGPERHRTYNPFGLQIKESSTLDRAAVKELARAAVANGTLPRTDYDDDELVARRAAARMAATFDPIGH